MAFESDLVVIEIGVDHWQSIEPLAYRGISERFSGPFSALPSLRNRRPGDCTVTRVGLPVRGVDRLRCAQPVPVGASPCPGRGRCADTNRVLPGSLMDKALTSDHCSVVPDYDHAACCVEHDWRYWQGGTRRQRSRADRDFCICLRGRTGPLGARLRWLGVRLGGVGLWPWPWPWRWGYGWRWPRTRAPRHRDSRYTAADQEQRYRRILEAARAADEAARKR